MKHRIFSIALLQMLIWNPGNGCLADNLTDKELQETDLETVSTDGQTMKIRHENGRFRNVSTMHLKTTSRLKRTKPLKNREP